MTCSCGFYLWFLPAKGRQTSQVIVRIRIFEMQYFDLYDIVVDIEGVPGSLLTTTCCPILCIKVVHCFEVKYFFYYSLKNCLETSEIFCLTFLSISSWF